jgi:multidrug efflux system membrane fusion protein
MHGTNSLDEPKALQERATGGLKRRILAVGAAVLVLGAGVIWFTGGFSSSIRAVAQSPQRGGAAQGQGRQGVPVEVAKASRKDVPVRLEALGTVTPIANVAVKTRIDTEIIKVHFGDGAYVKAGDLLFTLDDRALQAQLNEKLGNAQRNRAALEGAERDVRRYTELIAKGATTQLNLDNATTQANVLRGQVAADESTVENLKVQIGYCTIRAPISGRASMAAVKVGNFVRSADATPLATIIQNAPVYVSFPIPQRNLPELRKALGSEVVPVQAVIPGDSRKAAGQVTMVENTIDPTTGLVMARATMPNADDLLWPGTLVTVQVTLRTEPVVAVPSEAVQVSQNGPFVFVVKDGAVSVKPVTVARTIDGDSVISGGLSGDETVVTAGHLLLSEGTRVAVRQAKAGT